MSAAFVSGSGGGPRMCVLHILTPHGLLGAGRHPPGAVGSLKTIQLNAELLFLSAKKNNDPASYKGNFTSDVLHDFLDTHVIPALKDQYSGAFGPNPTVELVFCLDNAPGHLACTPAAATAATPARFNPLNLSRDSLIDAMMTVNCASLTVTHKLKDGTSKQIVTGMAVAEKGKRGSLGKVARLPELQEEARNWILDNSPYTLKNDMEAQLHLHGIKVLYTPPFYPAANPIEEVWSVGKTGLAIANTGHRSMSEAVEQFRKALYTDNLANPGVHNLRGGKFVPDDAGNCVSAQKLYDHAWYSKDGGIQYIIDNDKELRGDGTNTLKKLIISAAIRARGLKYFDRNALVCHIRRIMLEEGVDADAAADMLINEEEVDDVFREEDE